MINKIKPSNGNYTPYTGRGYPTAIQKDILKHWFGCSRYIYNTLLTLFDYRYRYLKAVKEQDIKILSELKLRSDLIFLEEFILQDEYTNELGKTYKVSCSVVCCGYIISSLINQESTSWLTICPRMILQYSAGDLIKAYSNFYRKLKVNTHICHNTGKLLGLPRYKSKHFEQSICMQGEHTSINNNNIRLPYTRRLRLLNKDPGLLKTRGLRQANNLISVTIKHTNANLYLITSLYDKPREIRKSGIGNVGIDLMAHKTEVGTIWDSHNYSLITDIYPYPIVSINRLEFKIINVQRKLAKQNKGSKRRYKTKTQLALLHYRLKNLLTNYYHHITSYLISYYKNICIETLDIKNMLSDGIKPLNRLVNDSRFGMIRSMLMYKVLDSDKGQLILADPYYPSTQLCSFCNKKPTNKIKLGVKSWTCEYC